MQFHGVPEGEHPWVHTPEERFAEYMRYLAQNDYTVIALRDVARYVDLENPPANPWAIVEERKAKLAEDPDSKDGELPSGPGLAADYPGDVRIERHPMVIFSDRFERSEVRGAWDSARDEDGRVLSLVENSPDVAKLLGKRSLRVEARSRRGRVRLDGHGVRSTDHGVAESVARNRD